MSRRCDAPFFEERCSDACRAIIPSQRSAIARDRQAGPPWRTDERVSPSMRLEPARATASCPRSRTCAPEWVEPRPERVQPEGPSDAGTAGRASAQRSRSRSSRLSCERRDRRPIARRRPGSRRAPRRASRSSLDGSRSPAASRSRSTPRSAAAHRVSAIERHRSVTARRLQAWALIGEPSASARRSRRSGRTVRCRCDRCSARPRGRNRRDRRGSLAVRDVALGRTSDRAGTGSSRRCAGGAIAQPGRRRGGRARPRRRRALLLGRGGGLGAGV